MAPPVHALAGLFKKIAESKASGGGNRITDGKYVFAIENMIFEQKEGGPTFIVELYVLESTNTHETIKALAKDTRCSFVCAFDSTKSAMGNCKAFILSLFGQAEDECTQDEFVEVFSEAVSKPSPTIGMTIAAETYRKTTRGGPNAGKVGVYPKWSTRSNTEAEVTATLAYISKHAKKPENDAEKKSA